MSKKKRMLIVAFELPPSNGASVQRIISIYEHFISVGWTVDILTVASNAYEKTLDTHYAFHEESVVIRAPALDIHRHLSFKGRHPGFLVRPDRWGATWQVTAKIMGYLHTRKNKPDVIWSSSPIPSVHSVAMFLKIKTGAKWIADYRDPMSYLQGGKNKRLNHLLKKIDTETVINADILTFATQEMKNTYLSTFKHMSIEGKSHVIRNGFIEKNFSPQTEIDNVWTKEISVYYAGVLYPDGRDPSPFFSAMSKPEGENLHLVFQGAGDGLSHDAGIQSLGLSKRIKFYPPVSFDDAITEMYKYDILLLIQGKRFNAQIPGKLYEYLRTGKPIILMSPFGSATSLEAEQFHGVYRCESEGEICAVLAKIRGEKRSHNRSLSEFSREYQAEKLEKIINKNLGEKT